MRGSPMIGRGPRGIEQVRLERLALVNEREDAVAGCLAIRPVRRILPEQPLFERDAPDHNRHDTGQQPDIAQRRIFDDEAKRQYEPSEIDRVANETKRSCANDAAISR